MEYLFTYLVLGMLSGGIYALIGLGVVVIYKATRVFNFAVGEMVMLGGAIGITIMETGIWWWLGIILTILVMGLVGWLIQKGIVSRLTERPILTAWVAVAILSQFLLGVTSCGWGGQTRSFPFFLPSGGFNIGTSIIPIPMDLSLSFITAIVSIGIFLVVFQYTKVGLGMKAVAEHFALSRSKGIKVNQIWGLAWIVGGMTAALGGIFFGYRAGIEPSLSLIGLKAFPVVFLGGLNSIPGVILGGLTIGIVESLAGGYISSDLAILSPFFFLLIVLAIRPQGILGEARVERI